MPRWLGYDRLVEIGAAHILNPKPPWWRPFERLRWRRDCASVGLIIKYQTLGEDAE